jgi:hypothetical protein
MDRTSWICTPFGMGRSFPILSRAGPATEDDRGDIKVKHDRIMVV